MKKIFLSALAATALIFVGTGCLKDEGYDDMQYGIKDVEVKGISFPQSASGGVNFALISQTTLQSVNAPVVALQANGKATQDIHVKLTLNPSLVTAAGLSAFDVADFSFVSDVVIPAGQQNATVQIDFPNASTIDASQAYGIGISIASADAGYVVASNMKDVLLIFNIKNKFDGEYSLRMRHDGWAAYGILDGAAADYPDNFGIVTAGPNSFTLENYYRADENLQPGFTDAGGATGFGAAAPLFTFNPDNTLLSVTNQLPDDGRGRVFQINSAVTDSRFDPTDKTLYLAYILKQTGRPDLQIYDTFTYVGIRK